MVLEMIKFRKLLDDEGITWHDASDKDVLDIYHIDRTHFTYCGYNWSVVHGRGTFGENQGLLEMMSNAVNDGDPLGWLTANEVFAYVKGEQMKWT